jgi:hypothetical protein
MDNATGESSALFEMRPKRKLKIFFINLGNHRKKSIRASSHLKNIITFFKFGVVKWASRISYHDWQGDINFWINFGVVKWASRISYHDWQGDINFWINFGVVKWASTTNTYFKYTYKIINTYFIITNWKYLLHRVIYFYVFNSRN